VTDKFVFMLKTYKNDLKYAERLVSSFHTHNLEKIPLYIVLPKTDLHIFKDFIRQGVNLIPEEEIPCKLADPSVDLKQTGYINQQVLKLAFYKLKIAENYLCLDSDGIFIRNFGLQDFLNQDGLPYQVLVDDKLLQSDGNYYKTYWEGRSKKLEQIAQFLGMEERKNLKSCHGFQILQSRVLESLENDFLSPKGLNFLDIIARFNYEFTWYNYYLQKTEPIIHITEPLFHTIHTPMQLIKYQLFSEIKTNFAKGHIGLIVNGNFQVFKWPATLEGHRVLNAAAYVKISDLIKICCRFGSALLLRCLLSPLAILRRIILHRR